MPSFDICEFNNSPIERVPPTEYGKHCRGTCVEGRLVMMFDAFPDAFAARLWQR